jgi:isopenicillin N synthase-like dioxygenase
MHDAYFSRLSVLRPSRTQIISNGVLRSPVHRAVSNAEKERISLAMFHGLDPDEEIEPAPAALLSENQPARYRTVKAKEYLAGFYEHFCRFIESVKIHLNEA